jgi:cytochrome c-type biogenesis protein CcmF
LLGTFLVRSGVLVSVHSFAADPTRGIFILAFLVIAIGGALALYAWRAPLLKSTAGFELTAREAFLLFNNVLLVIACATVFAGTMAPLISDALGLGTLSVGAQYFNPVFLLPVLPLLALVSVGIHAGWKKGRLPERKRELLSTFARALAIAVALLYGLFGVGEWLTPIGLALGIWIVLSSLVDPIDRWRRKLSMSPAVLGMALAHIGLGVFVLSITVVESFTSERDVALQVGESVQVGPYTYKLASMGPVEGPNYDGVRAEVVISRNGREVAHLYPEKRQYWVQRSVMTEAGIAMQGGRNVFAAIGEDLGGGKWSIRAQIRPWVNFVWLASVLMALGGILAACDRRYRSARVPATAPLAESTLKANT